MKPYFSKIFKLEIFKRPATHPSHESYQDDAPVTNYLPSCRSLAEHISVFNTIKMYFHIEISKKRRRDKDGSQDRYQVGKLLQKKIISYVFLSR